jgi:hypothetical protein
MALPAFLPSVSALRRPTRPHQLPVMDAKPPASGFPLIDLRQDRGWQVVLGLIFSLALFSRFLVHLDLAERPMAKFERWAGTESWMMALVAMETVERETWLIPGPNLVVRAEMLRAAPTSDWTRWTAERLPRGAPAYYLAAVSHALGGAFALYSLLSLLAGAMVPVLVAMAGARLFDDRRAGTLAGIAAASHHTLVVGSVFPGPWIWEALVLAALLSLALRLKDSPNAPAEWALLGITIGVGIWMRPLFWWGVPLMGFLFLRHRPAKPAIAAAFALVPVLLLAGGLTARNMAAGAPALPTVGQPAWDFLETTNPLALRRPMVPAELFLLDASAGSFLPTLRLSLGQPEFRQGLGMVLQRKIRELVGGRDVDDSLSAAYLRLRLQTLRLTTLDPLTAMGLAWGAFLFLLLRRRLPLWLLALVAVLLVHGLLFRTDGMNRTLLHLAGCLAAGGGLALASRDSGPGATGPRLPAADALGFRGLPAGRRRPRAGDSLPRLGIHPVTTAPH